MLAITHFSCAHKDTTNNIVSLRCMVIFNLFYMEIYYLQQRVWYKTHVCYGNCNYCGLKLLFSQVFRYYLCAFLWNIQWTVWSTSKLPWDPWGGFSICRRRRHFMTVIHYCINFVHSYPLCIQGNVCFGACSVIWHLTVCRNKRIASSWWSGVGGRLTATTTPTASSQIVWPACHDRKPHKQLDTTSAVSGRYIALNKSAVLLDTQTHSPATSSDACRACHRGYQVVSSLHLI